MSRRSRPSFEVAGLTDRGLVRLEDEDALLMRPDTGLFLVANGVSTSANSMATASSIAAEVAITRETFAVSRSSTCGAVAQPLRKTKSKPRCWPRKSASARPSMTAPAPAGVAVRVPDHVGRRRLRQREVYRFLATFCDRPWREILVRWDGALDVCNMFNPFSYGTLRLPGPERDMASWLRRVWDGPNARLFRSIVNTEEPHPYCRECYFLYP